MKINFTYQATNTGYTIFANGQPIGGAGTSGTATHTSDGRRRSWQARKKDLAMHSETARRTVSELEAGRGGQWLRDGLKKVLEGGK